MTRVCYQIGGSRGRGWDVILLSEIMYSAQLNKTQCGYMRIVYVKDLLMPK